MAILHRFGSADEFDPNKMQARELAYVNTTNKYYKAGLYLCYAPGDVRRQTTEQDIINLLNSNESAYTALQQLLTDLESNPSELTNILNNILALQTDKLDKVGDSKDNTVSFIEATAEEDIISEENHATLFGKILKSIKTFRTAITMLNDLANGKIDKTSIGQTDTVNDVNKVASTAITYAHGQEIDEINNNLADSGWITATLINGWTGSLIYRKKSGIVFVRLSNIANTIATSNAIFKLPTGYIPSQSCIVDTTAHNGSAGRIAIVTEGSIFVQSVSGEINVANALYTQTVSFPS